MYDFLRNHCSEWIGIGVRFGPESQFDFNRNCRSDSLGKSVRFGSESLFNFVGMRRYDSIDLSRIRNENAIEVILGDGLAIVTQDSIYISELSAS